MYTSFSLYSWPDFGSIIEIEIYYLLISTECNEDIFQLMVNTGLFTMYDLNRFRMSMYMLDITENNDINFYIV